MPSLFLFKLVGSTHVKDCSDISDEKRIYAQHSHQMDPCHRLQALESPTMDLVQLQPSL